MTVQCEHTFKTTVSTTKFEAVVAKTCKAPYLVEVIAHDPTIIPHVRIFSVGFTSPEDRDRVRIAMRFLEKEQAEMARARAPAPALGRLASA